MSEHSINNPILSYRGMTPRLGESVFVAPGAWIIGDVEIGDHSSVWFNTVVRGDVHHIRIGAKVNLQDLTMVHVTNGRCPTIIDDAVTVGHRAVLHGCHIERNCLIGMGAVVMDRARIGEFSLVGAGSVVTEGTIIPPRTLAVGTPARPRRPLTDAELEHLTHAADRYVTYASHYMKGDVGGGAP